MSEYRRPGENASRPQQRPAGARPAATRSAASRPQGSRPAGSRPPQGQRRPVKKKKKNNNLVLILLIVLVVAIGVAVLCISKCGGGDDPAATVTKPAAETAQTTDTQTENTSAAPEQQRVTENTDLKALLGQEGSVAGLTASQMVQVDDLRVTQGLDSAWMNVLLLGSDARSLTESARSDTMIICSINTQTGAVKLSSIMRDTAVDLNDIGQYSGTYRINSAHYFGGPELIMRTINENLGMNIEYYATVDFTSFSIIAEKLGGIDIPISEAEMGQINDNAIYQYRAARYLGIDESELESANTLLEQYSVNNEPVHLNGRQVLAYARIRKIDSDFSRVERQQKVLIALLEKARGKSAADILNMVVTLAPYLKTNLSVEQIISVATTVLGGGITGAQQMRIPMEGTYNQTTREGQSMLFDVNWDQNKQELYKFIYE